MKKVAILADFLEERWPSMDLVAEQLQKSLQTELGGGGSGPAAVELIRPALRRRFSGGQSFSGPGYTADRFLNRFADYPRYLRAVRSRFDLFHLADHSYSQLVHQLPPGRTVVTCHDLDSFRCLWEPGRGPLFRAMTRRILSGLKKAAHVCCDSEATCAEVLERGLLPKERLSVVPIGLRPEFSRPSDPAAESRVEKWLGDDRAETIDLLHVSSTIPRKRIDVLLEVFARIRRTEPRVRLLRVGGAFTAAQEEQIERLGLKNHIRVLPFLSPMELAVVYRRAAIVLLTSEAEGFGLPVIEALACGTPVVLSELPVLREVGADAAAYAPVGAVEAWEEQVLSLLRERSGFPARWEARREQGRRQAAKFSWARAAAAIAEIYRRIFLLP